MTSGLQQPLLGLPAPAKLNLFLHITGRRPDGYHLLQSAFMLVDWQDTIDLHPAANGHITRSDHGSAALPEQDLCVRAALALQQATGCTLGAHIHLHKTIPAQAGMGGGSSDAATVLIGLNRLWNLQLPPDELARIGLALGADVPFFLFGQHAWAEGVGEQLSPIALPAAQWVVIKPDAGVATADIFNAPDLPRNTPVVDKADFVASPAPWLFGRNDMQHTAVRLCPAIGQALQWLAGLGLAGRMTGSGSSVFAHLPAGFETGILQKTAPKNWHLRICSTIPAHPLLQLRA